MADTEPTTVEEVQVCDSVPKCVDILMQNIMLQAEPVENKEVTEEVAATEAEAAAPSSEETEEAPAAASEEETPAEEAPQEEAESAE